MTKEIEGIVISLVVGLLSGLNIYLMFTAKEHFKNLKAMNIVFVTVLAMMTFGVILILKS